MYKNPKATAKSWQNAVLNGKQIFKAETEKGRRELDQC